MENSNPQRPMRLLSKSKVKDLTCMANTALHGIQNPHSPYFDPLFPKPRRRGPTFPPFWLESEIHNWIENFGKSMEALPTEKRCR